MRGCVPSRWARAIAGEALRPVTNSRLGPRENSVPIVEWPTIPPAVDGRPFCLRRRAYSVESSVTDGVTMIAKKLADLLPREASLVGFNWFHFPVT